MRRGRWLMLLPDVTVMLTSIVLVTLLNTLYFVDDPVNFTSETLFVLELFSTLDCEAFVKVISWVF